MLCRRQRYCYASVLAFWVLVFTLLSSSTTLKAEEYTIHAGPNGYAPFFTIDRSSGDVVYSGLIYDLLDEFEDRHPEYTRKPILLTRKRANLEMARGEVFDLMFNSPLFVSDDILHHYQFTRTILTSKDVVVTRKDQNFEYEKPEDLFDKKVGTIRGYSYGKFDEYLKSGTIGELRVDNHTQAIGMLAKQRIDAYFGNIYVSPHYMKLMGLDASNFRFSTITMYEFEFGFAVNKRKPELHRKLDNFIQEVATDGTLDRLMKSYLD